MIGNPDLSNFRMQLPTNFFYKELVDAFMPALIRRPDFPYESLEDYVNHTITNTSIPGIDDDGVEQVKNRRTVSFAGGVALLDKINRKVTFTFTLKESFLNWFLLWIQFALYIERSAPDSETFMPDFYTQLMDYENKVIMDIYYQKIRMASITDLSLSYSDSSIRSDTSFDVVFYFNDIQLKHNLGIKD